jgi:Putative Zn-dependent protease, contains TPR repeats
MSALPKQPNPYDLQNLQHLVQSGQLQRAEIQALALVKSFPKSLPLLNLLGICQQGQGKLREAAASFRKMLTLNPQIPELHFNLG